MATVSLWFLIVTKLRKQLNHGPRENSSGENPSQRFFSEASSHMASKPRCGIFPLASCHLTTSLGFAVIYSFTASLRGVTNTGVVICNVFSGGVKTTTAPLCDWKTVITLFSVHSEHTLRRHSRGPSIHFRPSLSLIYNAGRIHEHPTQPPQHLSN